MKNPFRIAVNWLYYRERREDAPPLPRYGAGLFFRTLGRSLFYLMGMSLLTAVLCLPVVTIPASAAVLRAAAARLLEDGGRMGLREYFRLWKRSFVPMLLPGAAALVLAGGSAVLVWTQWGASGLLGQAAAAFGALLGLYAHLFWNYALSLFAVSGVRVRDAVSGAVLLIASEIKTDLLLILTQLGLNVLLVLLLPYSAPVFPLISLSLTSLLGACILKRISETAAEDEGPEKEP